MSHPPVLILSGEVHLLRRRRLAAIRAGAVKDGFTVDTIDAVNPGALDGAVSGGFLFDDGHTLVVVNNPEKADLDLLKAHAEETDPDVTLLLHVVGKVDSRTKFGKWVKTKQPVWEDYEEPPAYKKTAVAIEFVQAEAKLHKVTIAHKLAHHLVTKNTDDLGILSFELLKIATLARLDGSKSIEVAHLAGGMASLAEAEVTPVADALALKDRAGLLRALTRLEQTTGSDQTIRVTRFLAASVVRWMVGAHLVAMPDTEAAQEVGVSPWVYKNFVAPPAKRWGKKGTRLLVAHLAASERACLNGCVSPWMVLCSRLLSACTAP